MGDLLILSKISELIITFSQILLETALIYLKDNNGYLAFSGYRGSEPSADDAVQMVCKTGGVAVLAHPWALKNALRIVKRLKEAGLHGIEVYRSDGKLAGNIFKYPCFFSPNALAGDFIYYVENRV